MPSGLREAARVAEAWASAAGPKLPGMMGGTQGDQINSERENVGVTRLAQRAFTGVCMRKEGPTGEVGLKRGGEGELEWTGD